MRGIRVLLLAACAGAIGSSGAQAQTNQPYTLADIVDLVQGGHSAERILARVATDCISFRVNADAEEKLQKEPALIAGLKQACYRAAPTTTGGRTPPPAPVKGIIDIEGPLPPGWTRTANKLDPTVDRRITLTPGWAAVIVVRAPGWCADTLHVTLQSGQQQKWVPQMKPRSWVDPC